MYAMIQIELLFKINVPLISVVKLSAKKKKVSESF